MSNYIPYLSSSPPPLELKESPDDDEEDFGNFASANFSNNDKSVDAPPTNHVSEMTKKASSDHIAPVNLKSQLFTPNHVNACNFPGTENHDAGKPHNKDTSDVTSSSKSAFRNDSKDSDADDVLPEVDDQSKIHVLTKSMNNLETDCCDNGSSCTDDWAEFAVTDGVGDISSSLPENDAVSAWNSVAEEESVCDVSRCETLQTESLQYGHSDANKNGFLSNDDDEDDDDDFTDFTVFNQSSITGDATFRTDFEPDVIGATADQELTDEPCSSVEPSLADGKPKDGGNASDDVNVLSEEAASAGFSAEGGDDNDDDEFTNFVCPSDDCSVLVDKPVLPVANWSSTAVAGSTASDDSLKSISRRGSDDTFQAPFEANFDDEFSTFTSAPVCFASQGTTDAKTLECIIRTNFVEHSISASDECESIAVLNDSSKCFQTDIWPNLSDFEKTNALTYHWSNSNSSKKLLKSLNIDSRNLLFGHNWNSSIPIFAANLSFNPLEPIKTPWKPEERGDLPVTEPANQITKSGEVREVIPPAQFDWNSSGLTNPLDASNNSSALLDLDYFYTNDSTPTKPVNSAIWSLENELLGPSAENKHDSVSRSFPLLEQILSNAKFSASNLPAPKEQVELSPEAKTVISRLPDLNFMQARVLMFPIRNVSP